MCPTQRSDFFGLRPHRASTACMAATLGDALDGCPSGAKKIAAKLHVDWGDASAQQSNRVPAASDWDKMHLLACADEVSEQLEVCGASYKALHVPTAGTSAISTFNEKSQVGLLFLGDIVALHAMDVFSSSLS